MFQKIGRYIAPYVLSAAAFLMPGCPDSNSGNQQSKPPLLAIPGAEQPVQHPQETPVLDQLPINQNQDYRTVSATRNVRSGNNIFPVKFEVTGPERVKRGEKATYILDLSDLSLEYVALGAAAPKADVEFFPEGRAFRKTPPRGDLVATTETLYPFEQFAKLLPGYEEALAEHQDDLSKISGFGRDRIKAEIVPQLPAWYSSLDYRQSDLSLFTISGGLGFRGARQEFVVSAQKDTELNCFAFANPWGIDENLLMTADFFIDVEEPESNLREKPVVTPIGTSEDKKVDLFSMSPDGKKIALYADSDVDARVSIFRVDDPMRKTRVQNKALSMGLVRNFVYSISWSPDSRKILYSTIMYKDEPGTEDGLWVMDIETGESKKLIDYSANNHCWSPANRILASCGWPRDILSIDPETGEAKNLTMTTDIPEEDPFWSPRGTHIAFTTSKDVWTAASDVWVMEADGTNRRNLTNTQEKQERAIGWLGDNVLSLDDRGVDTEVLGIDVHGRKKVIYNTRRYLDEKGTPREYNYERGFTPSEDGRLLFQAGGRRSERALGDYNCYNLFLLDTGTGVIEMLTREKNVLSSVTSPDMREIFYIIQVRQSQGPPLNVMKKISFGK